MNNKILVVDDQAENRGLLARILMPLGLSVEEADGGAEAIRKCSESPPDVILLDVVMPEMEGIEVLRRLKARPETEHIPVIMLTGLENRELLTECIRTGAEDYIVKPFRREFLLARLQASLRKKELADVRFQLISQMSSEVDGLRYGIANAVRESSDAQRSVIFALACLAEQRDPETGEHLERVQGYADVICRALPKHPVFSLLVSDSFLRNLPSASVLHDIGKVGVPDAVLQKPGKLTDEEYAQIKIHPEAGARILQDVQFLHPLIPYCLYHHERYDGKGYPYGLKAETIPVEGRLVAVADTFDALTSNRPYRKGLPPEVAIAEIEKGRGTQFDPICADAFISAWRQGKIDRILQDYYSKDEKSIACPFCSTHIRLPEGAKVEDIFECEVCHRQIKLMTENEAFYGELMPQSGAAKRITTVVPPISTKVTVRGNL